jgi:hypothetical protein
MFYDLTTVYFETNSQDGLRDFGFSKDGRIAKSSLEVRPVFHYNSRRIKAHFLICYMSLALIRYVEFALNQKGLHYPCEQFHRLLDQMRLTQIHHTDNTLYEILEDPPKQLPAIYRALQLSWHQKFSY